MKNLDFEEKVLKETIKLRGSSGKPIEMTLNELLTKKINSKVEVENGKYFVKLTRWYRLDKTFSNLSEATVALVKITQKLDKLKMLKN